MKRSKCHRIQITFFPAGQGVSFWDCAASRVAVVKDWTRFSALIREDAMQFRVGSGHDTHRLGVGYPLILGGVQFDYPRGLIGHSDADVVLHALTDALLGAVGMGDIGDAYPDTDPQWKGADSQRFLKETLSKLNQLGWTVVNTDITILAQVPKLGPAKTTIREKVAELLRISIDRVNVKAKTGEKVGHIGREEAIGCQVVVLVQNELA